MATTPGILSEWPWQSLGNYKVRSAVCGLPCSDQATRGIRVLTHVRSITYDLHHLAHLLHDRDAYHNIVTKNHYKRIVFLAYCKMW